MLHLYVNVNPGILLAQLASSEEAPPVHALQKN